MKIAPVQANTRQRASGGALGFSLVETVAVLALLGLLLGLAVPSYLNYGSTQRARTAAQQLVRDLQVARQEAIKRRAPVTVRFSAAERTCSPAEAAAYVLQQGTAVLKRTCLPPDVVWLAVPRPTLVFLSTGEVSAGIRLQVWSRRTARTYTVQVGTPTGVITHDAR